MKKRNRTVALLTAIWYGAVNMLTASPQLPANAESEPLTDYSELVPFSVATVTDHIGMDNGQLLSDSYLGLLGLRSEVLASDTT